MAAKLWHLYFFLYSRRFKKKFCIHNFYLFELNPMSVVTFTGFSRSWIISKWFPISFRLIFSASHLINLLFNFLMFVSYVCFSTGKTMLAINKGLQRSVLSCLYNHITIFIFVWCFVYAVVCVTRAWRPCFVLYVKFCPIACSWSPGSHSHSTFLVSYSF